MKLIITEKPSVAQDFAKAMNGATSKGGYIETAEYTITWAIGHLIEIAKDNIPEKVQIEQLPFIPENFKYEVNAEKRKQYAIIKELSSKAHEVIIATDSGREGELIARLILKQAGWQNWTKTFRFWSSEALTPAVVIKGLSAIKPSGTYDSLYFSALARQQADWLCGVNLSILFSQKAQGNWSLGRVQTPTLSLIVNRFKEIENFIPQQYYVISVDVAVKNGNYTAFLNMDIADKESEEDETSQPSKLMAGSEAQRIYSEVSLVKDGKIKDVICTDKTLTPPLLHSLTSLQREANSVFGYSASNTLNYAQALYEKHKAISYPRTDSQHLAESSKTLVVDLLNRLGKSPLTAVVGKIGKRLFDDSKLTDHHAIIPLALCPDTVTKEEANIYRLIVRKFTGVFMDNYTYEQTRIITTFGKYDFTAVGNVIKQKGWKALYSEEPDNSPALPAVTTGEAARAVKYNNQEKFTQAPKFFTESTLLKKMEKLMLGTPATRASIIEKLLERVYIVREKKNLVPTEKGLQLIELTKDSSISNPEMTSAWEERLEQIYRSHRGFQGYYQFLNDIVQFVRKEVDKYKGISFTVKHSATAAMLKFAKELAKQRGVKLTSDEFGYIQNFINEAKQSPPPSIGKCSCGNDITDSYRAFNCVCGKIVWKEIAGKKLNAKQAVELMNGKIISVSGLTGKKGKFDAKLKLKLDNKIEFMFDK